MSKNKRKIAQRERIIAAAESLIMSRGPSNSTVADIAGRAQCSKRAIYTHFGGKDQLLIAVIKSRAGRLSQNLRDALVTEKGVRDTLFDYVMITFEVTHAEGHVGVVQTLLTEMRHSPGLGAQYWEVGPAPVMQVLTEYLQEEHRLGNLMLDDSEAAGRYLLAMAHWPQREKMLLQVTGSRSRQSMRHEANRIVANFIKLYGIPD